MLSQRHNGDSNVFNLHFPESASVIKTQPQRLVMRRRKASRVQLGHDHVANTQVSLITQQAVLGYHLCSCAPYNIDDEWRHPYVSGTVRFKHGHTQCYFAFANSTVSPGQDSFASFKGTQDSDPSFHCTSSFQPDLVVIVGSNCLSISFNSTALHFACTQLLFFAATGLPQ